MRVKLRKSGIIDVGISQFQRSVQNISLLPGATRSAALHACPWLSYFAPLALHSDFLCNAKARRVQLLLYDFASSLRLCVKLSIFQLTHVRADGFAEGFEIVTAFETRNDAAPATAVSPLLQCPREVNKIMVHQQQLPQRVAEMRIKARGDTDQIRIETRRHLLDRRFKPSLVLDRRRVSILI